MAQGRLSSTMHGPTSDAAHHEFAARLGTVDTAENTAKTWPDDAANERKAPLRAIGQDRCWDISSRTDRSPETVDLPIAGTLWCGADSAISAQVQGYTRYVALGAPHENDLTKRQFFLPTVGGRCRLPQAMLDEDRHLRAVLPRTRLDRERVNAPPRPGGPVGAPDPGGVEQPEEGIEDRQPARAVVRHAVFAEETRGIVLLEPVREWRGA